MDEEQLRLNTIVGGLRSSVSTMQQSVTQNSSVLSNLNSSVKGLSKSTEVLKETFKTKTDELKKSFTDLDTSIKKLSDLTQKLILAKQGGTPPPPQLPGGSGAAGGSGGSQPPSQQQPTPGPTPAPSFGETAGATIASVVESLENILVTQLTQAVGSFFSAIKAQAQEFISISDQLLSVGFSIDQFRSSYAENNSNLVGSNDELNQRMVTIAGSLQDAAKNTQSLVEAGIDPLSLDILNLAGTMGTLGQDVGKLMKVNQALFTQGGLNSDDLNSLAATLDRARVEQSVSTEKLIESMSKLESAFPQLNVAGITKEANELTIALAAQLGAGAKEQAGELVALLTTVEGSIMAQQLGIGDITKKLASGADPETVASDLISAIGPAAGRILTMGGDAAQAGAAGTAAVLETFGQVGTSLVNIFQAREKAGEGGEIDQIESFLESFGNLQKEIMKPIEEAGAMLAEKFSQYVPAILEMIQTYSPSIKNGIMTVVNGILQVGKILLFGLPNIIRVLGTLVGALAGFKIVSLAVSAKKTAADAIIIGLLTTIAAPIAAASLGTAGAAGAAAAGAATAAMTGAQAAALGVGAAVGAGVGLVLADELATPLEGMLETLESIDGTAKREEARASEKDTQDRLERLQEYQRQQASDFDRFLKDFMTRNMDQMALTNRGQGELLVMIGEKIDNLTNVTDGTPRRMGEVVEAAGAAGGLRNEDEPQ